MARNGWLRILCMMLVCALGACGPRAKDLQAGEKGEVAKVLDGDTLELKSGLRVHLVSIEAPREDEALANKARDGLQRLAAQRAVRLYYGGTSRLAAHARNPDEAALAHVYVRTEGGRWLWAQEAMLRDGLARVHTRKDNSARAEKMLAIEALARGEKRGLWAASAYRVRAADKPIEPSGFLLAEGKVINVGESKGRVFLNFGEDYRSDFTVMIGEEDLPNFKPPFDAKALASQRVRVRGYVSDRGGPLMRIDHPAQIEVLG